MNHIEAMKQVVEALEEMLAAERATNRPPETVMQAEEKLERIRKAATQCTNAIALGRQAIAEAEKQVSYSGNGTAGRENMTAPTGFFFQMPKQEPIARVTGTYGGRFVVEPLNPAMVLPTNMALYAEPQPKAEKQEPVAWEASGKLTALREVQAFVNQQVRDAEHSLCLIAANPQPKREWVSLTLTDREELHMKFGYNWPAVLVDAVIAKFKEKNGWSS